MARMSGTLYLVHAILELGLGAMKLRGRYDGQKEAGPEAKLIQHHGVALLALALLGGLVWYCKLGETETGQITSAVLCFFHAGAAAVHAHAWSTGSAKSASVFAMHLPFALLFLLDAFRTRGPSAGAAKTIAKPSAGAAKTS